MLRLQSGHFLFKCFCGRTTFRSVTLKASCRGWEAFKVTMICRCVWWEGFNVCLIGRCALQEAFKVVLISCYCEQQIFKDIRTGKAFRRRAIAAKTANLCRY